jgi:O-antigen/teichoic acid export membrane protein
MLVQLLLLVFLVVVLDKGIGGAFIAHASADLMAGVVFFIMLWRYDRRPKKPDLALLGESLVFGIKSYVSNLMRQLSLRLDVFLLTVLAAGGIQATGVYSVATSVAELILFVPQSIRLSLFPMVAASSTVEANRLTSQASRHTLFLTTACGAIIAILAGRIIPFLYGDNFAAAVFPLLILLPGVVMLSQAHIFYGDLTGRGRPGTTAISALLSLMVTIVLDIILIPRYGIAGAALAATCAYGLEFAIAGCFFLFYSGLSWKDVFLFRRSDLRHYYGYFNNATKVVTTT